MLSGWKDLISASVGSERESRSSFLLSSLAVGGEVEGEIKRVSIVTPIATTATNP